MEEQILKIIVKHYDIFGKEPFPMATTAKEITSHVMEFIEWLMWNDDEKFTQGCIKDEKGLRAVDDDNNEWTLDELYQYWLNNIKNKDNGNKS